MFTTIGVNIYTLASLSTGSYMDGLLVSIEIQSSCKNEIQKKTLLSAARICAAQNFVCDEREKYVNLNLRLMVCF
jgi:hypothetical protein